MTLGKALPADADARRRRAALGAAIEAVKARGKSDAGQKTMLDVLAPVHAELRRGRARSPLRIKADGAAPPPRRRCR